MSLHRNKIRKESSREWPFGLSRELLARREFCKSEKKNESDSAGSKTRFRSGEAPSSAKLEAHVPCTSCMMTYGAFQILLSQDAPSFHRTAYAARYTLRASQRFLILGRTSRSFCFNAEGMQGLRLSKSMAICLARSLIVIF